MRKLIVFLMVLSLIFMSVAPSVFGAYANVGPTTEFQGDVGTTGDFLVNGTKIALTNLTTAGLINEAMFDADAPANLDILTYSSGGTNFLWKEPSQIITAGTLIAWTGTTLNVVIPAEHIDSDMYIDGSIDHEHLAVDVFTGWAADSLAAADVLLFYDDNGADINKITWDNLMGSITTLGTVTSGGLGTSATLGAVTVNIGSAAANDILYLGASAVLSRLASNSNADNRFLRTISSGTPSYEIVTFSDLGNSAANKEIDFTTHSIEFSFDSGGELQIGDGGATNYFQVDYAGVVSFGGTGRLTVPADNIDPASNVGDFVFDTTVANMTNGNPAIWDGTSIRYFITLATADIWTTNDDVVVAYDAGNDKFYLKEDATSAGNWVLHLMDVNAADEEYYLNDDDTDSGNIMGGVSTQAAYARNVTTTGTDTGGTVTVTGTLADGTVGASEGIPIINGVQQGEVAFMNITAMTVDGASNTFDVGIGDIIGLPNDIDGVTDVYMKTVDGVDDFDQITGNVDITENTLDCGTIVQNEDITIYYHN